uniref:non-specific serine/threonine protein kinase n=1 Tax=Melanopsichium pennsylvanicum 4 TaxID=1398559 RepID=A0A077R765_9BASI|nr:related to IKS1-putative serine/threonine kinase [Melanopsichium pennsylvanicum 4]
MASSHRPSPLRASDATWLSSSTIVSEPSSSSCGQRASSSLDLVPAPRASDLQIVLRTRDHAAYYDPSNNELSLQTRASSRSLDASASEPTSPDATLIHHRTSNPSRASQSLLQRFTTSPSIPKASRNPICPTCARPWPLANANHLDSHFDTRFQPSTSDREDPSFIAPNYFRLLAQATSNTAAFTRPATPRFSNGNRFESASGNSTPVPPSRSSSPLSESEPIHPSTSAQGYYSRFFVELKRLGRGARGQVFLCQHVLNGNKLGKYAIKKIPVGDHAQSLLQSLNEVHLMETLHHPHLIHYQHAWIERCQLSAFGPEVPTLFVLMMAANGGSLADWISARTGDASANIDARDSLRASGDTSTKINGKRGSSQGDGGDGLYDGAGQEMSSVGNPEERRKIERLKAALRQRRAKRSTATTTTTTTTTPSSNLPQIRGSPNIDIEVGVHLLKTEEIHSLLFDMTSGLSFLHTRGILHLDIKPGNVLLHWDEDSLIPRALLSDFGSSLFLHDIYSRIRSGHTGTMEYMSPETILTDPTTGRLSELSSKADIWSLGVVLHLLVFFRLPFCETEDLDKLKQEMRKYPGFRTDRNSDAGGDNDDADKRWTRRATADDDGGGGGAVALSSDTVSTLILVLALIDLSAHSRIVKVACWGGHFVVLFMYVYVAVGST